jgi:hypothetical protein
MRRRLMTTMTMTMERMTMMGELMLLLLLMMRGAAQSMPSSPGHRRW